MSINYFVRSTLALTKSSFLIIRRSPSFILFSIVFPLVFIFAFGFIGGNSTLLKIAFKDSSNTDNFLYTELDKLATVKIIPWDEKNTPEEFDRGFLDGIIDVKVFKNQSPTKYEIEIWYTSSSPNGKEILQQLIENIVRNTNPEKLATIQNIAIKEQVIVGSKSNQIDFILPGQLGFSLMSSGVFGTAFAFVVARRLFIIKKYFTTPVSKYSILISEVLSRTLFSLLSSIIIVGLGYTFFEFTLRNGWVSFVNILILSIFSLFLFLGVGLLISSLVKEEKNVPPLANIFTLPQFLISGTFFPISVYPFWLQKIALLLPLTYLNEGLRKIAFEGANLWDIKYEIFILVLWTILVFAITARFFRWQ